MEGLIVLVLSLSLYLWLCSLGNKGNGSNQNFGDGKSRYDFKDYVDKKADEDLK